MSIIITVIHVIACLFLIGVVLLQQGKGADMGAVFGGSSSTIFGSGGAGNFLTRLTTGMAVVFMLTSLVLSYSGARRVSSTVFDSAPLPEPPPLSAPANAPEGNASAAGEAAAPGAGEAAAPAAPAPAAAGEQPAAVAPQAPAPQAAAPAEAPPSN